MKLLKWLFGIFKKKEKPFNPFKNTLPPTLYPDKELERRRELFTKGHWLGGKMYILPPEYFSSDDSDNKLF